MGVYRRGNRCWIEYEHEGKRYRESAGRTRRVADQALAVRRAEIAQGKFRIEATRRSPRFEDFAEEYLAWAKVNHRSTQTTEALRVHRLAAALKGRPLRDLTAWHIERYKAHRRKEVSAGTVNRELSVLSSILSRAIEWGKLYNHPMRGGKVKYLAEAPGRLRVLTDEEEMRLLKASGPELHDLITLAVDTGGRLSELCRLTPEDIHGRLEEIRLRYTKNGRERRIPLTPRALAILTDRCRGLAPGAPLFPARPGQRPWRLASAFRRACAGAKISGLRFHDLRHTFATRLRHTGADLAQIRELLGHADLRMTLRYAHASAQGARQAIAALAARQRVPTKVPTVRKSEGGARRVSNGF